MPCVRFSATMSRNKCSNSPEENSGQNSCIYVYFVMRECLANKWAKNPDSAFGLINKLEEMRN